MWSIRCGIYHVSRLWCLEASTLPRVSQGTLWHKQHLDPSFVGLSCPLYQSCYLGVLCTFMESRDSSETVLLANNTLQDKMRTCLCSIGKELYSMTCLCTTCRVNRSIRTNMTWSRIRSKKYGHMSEDQELCLHQLTASSEAHERVGDFSQSNGINHRSYPRLFAASLTQF